jgi:hypothetical protein
MAPPERRMTARPPAAVIRRPHLLLAPGAPLVCPRPCTGRSHVLRHNAAILDHEALICQHRAASGAPPCGARVYVVQLGHGWRYMLEIAVREMLYLREHQLSQREALAYLAHAPDQFTSEGSSDAG